MHTQEGMRPGRPPQMDVPLYAIGLPQTIKARKQNTRPEKNCLQWGGSGAIKIMARVPCLHGD
jgi:hypothetical protein